MRLLSLLVLLIFTSCNVINPDEQEPAYLHIESFELNVQPGEGTESHKITEIWVYANDEIVGVFDLPANIPVLNTGVTDIRIFAGIKNNGISATRIRYPFYEPFDTLLNITAGALIEMMPSFKYWNDLEITEKGFESGNFLIPWGQNQGTFNVVTDDRVFEGNRSGLGELPAGSSVLQYKDDENLVLDGGNFYFLELNYSCNNKMAIGLIKTESGTQTKQLAVIVNPTATGTGSPVWNKIYVDFGLIPSENADADFFELYFEVIPDDSSLNSEIYLDNIKWVKWQ